MCLTCSYHSLPEVCAQSAELLATFDRPAARVWRPPPLGRRALIEALPSGWASAGGGPLDGASFDGGSGPSALKADVCPGRVHDMSAACPTGTLALEAALAAGTDGAAPLAASFGASVPLAWTALWRQAGRELRVGFTRT